MRTELVINDINYLGYFRLCKHWPEKGWQAVFCFCSPEFVMHSKPDNSLLFVHAFLISNMSPHRMYHKTGPHAKLYKKSCNNRFVLGSGIYGRLGFVQKVSPLLLLPENFLISSPTNECQQQCEGIALAASHRAWIIVVWRGHGTFWHVRARAWLWFSCQLQRYFIGVWHASLTVRQRSLMPSCSRWTLRGCLHACILSTSP